MSSMPLVSPAPRTAARAGAPLRLTLWDLLGILAGVALTLTITVVNARGRIFWEDEMLAWMLLRDPSWHHMIRAWNLGADGGGFSFYLLGRAWFALVGASVLKFRLFSSCCFAGAFVALWVALRRFYRPALVAFACFNTIFFSPPLTMHFLEGRFYGLLVFGTALAMWLTLVLDAAPDAVPVALLAGAFLVHGLLSTSHVLGIVYSGSMLAATVALDLLRGRRRLPLYLTIAASWLLLLPERESIVAAGRVGKPHFWTTAPTPGVILGAYSGFSHEILAVLVVLLVAAAFVLHQGAGGVVEGLRRRFHERSAIYVVGLALLLVTVVLLLQGLVGTWLFTDRYLQPVTLALALVTAELASIVIGWPAVRRTAGRMPRSFGAAMALATLAYVLLLLGWDFHHTALLTPEAPDFTDALTAHLPHDLPVVVDDGFTFTGLLSRQANSGVQYTYVLDWPFTISSNAPRVEVTQYHLMENWRLAGYFADKIEPLDEFLRRHDRFLVVHGDAPHPDPTVKPIIGNPLTARFAHNPGYEVRPYFILDRAWHDNVRETVSLVCRGSCGSTTPPQPDRCILLARGVTCCSGPDCKLPEGPTLHHFWAFWKPS